MVNVSGGRIDVLRVAAIPRFRNGPLRRKQPPKVMCTADPEPLPVVLFIGVPSSRVSVLIHSQDESQVQARLRKSWRSTRRELRYMLCIRCSERALIGWIR